MTWITMRLNVKCWNYTNQIQVSHFWWFHVGLKWFQDFKKKMRWWVGRLTAAVRMILSYYVNQGRKWQEPMGFKFQEYCGWADQGACFLSHDLDHDGVPEFNCCFALNFPTLPCWTMTWTARAFHQFYKHDDKGIVEFIYFSCHRIWKVILNIFASCHVPSMNSVSNLQNNNFSGFSVNCDKLLLWEQRWVMIQQSANYQTSLSILLHVVPCLSKLQNAASFVEKEQQRITSWLRVKMGWKI